MFSVDPGVRDLFVSLANVTVINKSFFPLSTVNLTFNWLIENGWLN